MANQYHVRIFAYITKINFFDRFPDLGKWLSGAPAANCFPASLIKPLHFFEGKVVKEWPLYYSNDPVLIICSQNIVQVPTVVFFIHCLESKILDFDIVDHWALIFSRKFKEILISILNLFYPVISQ